MLGHRAIYKDGWRAVCPWPGPSFAEAGTGFGNPISAETLTELDATGWELYHIDEDPAENHNLAAEHRDKLIELIGTWYVEAGKYGVMPVDGSGLARMIGEKPLVALPRNQYTYRPGTQSIPNFAAPRLLNRPHSITASVEIPEGGAEGVLFCQGTAAGGYSLYVKDGRLHYVHNYVARELFTRLVARPAAGRRHELRFEFEPTGQPDMAHGQGVPARLQLYVDGALVASADAPYTTPFMFNPGGVSCGHNPGSPVTPEYTEPVQVHRPPREGRRGRQWRADRRPRGRAADAHGAPVAPTSPNRGRGGGLRLGSGQGREKARGSLGSARCSLANARAPADTVPPGPAARSASDSSRCDLQRPLDGLNDASSRSQTGSGDPFLMDCPDVHSHSDLVRKRPGRLRSPGSREGSSATPEPRVWIDTRSGEQAELNQISAQLRRVDEPDGNEPEPGRSLDVREGVVDEDRVAGIDPVGQDEVVEYPGVRLDGSDIARDHDAIEPVEERVPPAGHRERLGRPVAQGVEPRPPPDVDRPGSRRNRRSPRRASPATVPVEGLERKLAVLRGVPPRGARRRPPRVDRRPARHSRPVS